MREEFGDAWELAKSADALCLTTNGYVKSNGHGVMGRGIAKQAKDRIPSIELFLGRHLQENGNHVGMLVNFGYRVYAFPVKHVWDQPADLQLIERSCRELMELIADHKLDRVILPRPGCGNGSLRWEDVKPIIEPILDDRIVVVDYVRA